MDEQLGDENLSSTLLKKQLERIKKKEEIRDVFHESTETEFSVPCSIEAYDSKNANMQFWRFVAGKTASELDKLRADNLNLKNLINSGRTRLDELKDLNTEMLEKAQCLDNAALFVKTQRRTRENMPGGTLCQVQNISTHAIRKAEELKVSKKTTTNTKDGNEQMETKTGNQNVKRDLLNNEKKLNETRVSKTEPLHEKPNTVEAAVQTDVTASTKLPKLTAEDLRSPEVSANYWRKLAERLYAENEREAKINFELSIRLVKLNEEIMEEEKDYQALKNYISVEENIEHFSGTEFKENEEAAREDEDKSGEHVPEKLYSVMSNI